MIHREVQFEVCFLRPCSEEGSDATKPIKNNSRLRQQCRTSKLTIRRRGGSWVEPLPIAENWQVRMADQAMYHQGNQSVFVGGRLWTLLPHQHLQSIPCIHVKKSVEKQKTNRRKFYIYADGPHTRLAAARLFLRSTSGKGYYPFPEAEMASKYREESSAELILKLTRPRQGMPPCDGLGPTMCGWIPPSDWQGEPNLPPRRSEPGVGKGHHQYPRDVRVWPCWHPCHC